MKSLCLRFRSLEGLALWLVALPTVRQVQLTCGTRTVTLPDAAADQVAAEVMHTHRLSALGLIFSREVAHRLARTLRKAAVPDPSFSQEWAAYGDTERAYARAEVSRHGRLGEATTLMPTSGWEALVLVRRAAKAALRSEGGQDALHDRVNHQTAEDRRIEAGWLRGMGAWTLADVLAGRHFPF